MSLEDLHSEIEEQLGKLAEEEGSKERIAWFKQQHKGSELECYGIKTSFVRKLIKKHIEHFRELRLNERFDLAALLYGSGYFEQATVGDSLLELDAGQMQPEDLALLDRVADHFNNWASVDRLCLQVMQPMLQKHPKETLRLLRRWNGSGNMWKRRASVVSFVWKIGSSGRFTNEALELCENLIWDKEELVLKGVGWALRDNMNGAKKRVIEYTKSLRRRGVSSKVTLYAIENLKGNERKEVLRVGPEKKG